MSASETIKVLSGAAMRTFLAEIVPLFEQANGAKVDVEYRLTSVLKKEIAEGIAFDIALLPRPEIDELTAASRIGEGASADVARSTVGLCVRAGAPKPDIATVPAFKAALVAASTISYSDGPSGAYVGDLLGKLGLAEAMKAKTRLTSRPVAELVASGEAEIGLQQIARYERIPVLDAVAGGYFASDIQHAGPIHGGHGDERRALRHCDAPDARSGSQVEHPHGRLRCAHFQDVRQPPGRRIVSGEKMFHERVEEFRAPGLLIDARDRPAGLDDFIQPQPHGQDMGAGVPEASANERGLSADQVLRTFGRQRVGLALVFGQQLQTHQGIHDCPQSAHGSPGFGC